MNYNEIITKQFSNISSTNNKILNLFNSKYLLNFKFLNNDKLKKNDY